MATAVTETTTPRRVESTVLVVEEFRDTDGTSWRPGDRVPLARRAIREAVRARPERFVVEFETLPVTRADLDGWLAELDADYQGRYEQVKARRDGAEERRQQALRAELEAQSRPDSSQRDLERRYRQQEKERAKRRERAREERERRQIENEVQFGPAGFQYDR